MHIRGGSNANLHCDKPPEHAAGGAQGLRIRRARRITWHVSFFIFFFSFELCSFAGSNGRTRKNCRAPLVWYEVTPVRLLITTCFSLVNFGNYVEYKLHFWLCWSALLIMQQWCRSCDSAVIDVSVLLTSCNSTVDHATVPPLMWQHCIDVTVLLTWCDSTVNHASLATYGQLTVYLWSNKESTVKFLNLHKWTLSVIAYYTHRALVYYTLPGGPCITLISKTAEGVSSQVPRKFLSASVLLYTFFYWWSRLLQDSAFNDHPVLGTSMKWFIALHMDVFVSMDGSCYSWL